MPRQPLSRERICDALESCRPGSNDLSAPEFTDVAAHIARSPEWEAVYERIQNTDLKISAAFLDVEIPPGLEQRLVASLDFARAEDALSAALAGPAETEMDNAPSADTLAASKVASSDEKNRKISRRWLVLAGGILTVAAALFLAVFLGINHSTGYSPQTVLDEAKNFFAADDPTDPGQLLARVPAPREFPLSKAIRPFGGIRWRTIKNFLGREGVAFDLPPQGGVHATLYAVDLTIANLDPSPTWKPANTGGCCVAAWQENGVAYVLVVQGSQKSYREYLNPLGPMA
jgi:hypothetical protein